jgi:hypothetical protein
VSFHLADHATLARQQTSLGTMTVGLVLIGLIVVGATRLTSHLQLHWVIVMNAQGKTRLDKWFTPHGSVRFPPPATMLFGIRYRYLFSHLFTVF